MPAKNLSFVLVTFGLWGALTCPETVFARSFRTSQYPNGNVLGCAACHVNPAGGGTRTPFGNRVFQIIGGSPNSVPFWSPMLAGEDSDGDTYCNGQEVGDPEGDGTATPGATVTNPGVSSSQPTNSPPAFLSSPVLQAIMGLPYQYQAQARDPDTCQRLTFSKIQGPAWLTVSSNGLVSGTPPDDFGSNVQVRVRVTDNGPSPLFVNQTYTLSVVASFAGWQRLKFNLPAETNLAGPFLDPDTDGAPNWLEYVVRSDPRASNVVLLPRPAFSADGRLRAELALRDDDPTLTARMEVAPTVLFTSFLPSEVTVTNLGTNTGFKLWRFLDPVPRTNAAARFGRIKVEFAP